MHTCCFSRGVPIKTFRDKLFDNLLCFQSKLNCEVLHDDLAFEVRWAVAGESVVIQLVAKLGEFDRFIIGRFSSFKNL